MPPMTETLRLRLAGAGGEPVDLWRTFLSHGVASLPPMKIDEAARTLDVTVALGRGKPRSVVVREAGTKHAAVEVLGRAPSPSTAREILSKVSHILRLDEDLSPLYERCAADADLAWICRGAGRMIRSATVFEDVVKTICTTNCTWSSTVRMVGALVENLGEPSAGGLGRAFPTPRAMAAAPEAFYRDVARAGYRGAYLRALAASAAVGSLDLEALATAGPADLPDDELEQQLLALPGVGPYAAAHIMMLIGRHSRLILDSWTRPTYARLNGGRKAADRTIERRFRRYGPYAGLAFWLYLTRDWVKES
jgi:3-methyladenine DNA glycosylase/8-oxoguanine DNA glycosylase